MVSSRSRNRGPRECVPHVGRYQVSRFRDKMVRLRGRCQMLADLGLLALRLALGAVFLAHGAQKSVGAFGGPGFAGAAGFIGSIGFRPARLWTALAVGGELAAGLLFLLGLWLPLAGLLVIGTMAVAIAKVHGPKGFFVQDGGYEYNLVLIVRSEERRVGKECRSRWSPYH